MVLGRVRCIRELIPRVTFRNGSKGVLVERILDKNQDSLPAERLREIHIPRDIDRDGKFRSRNVCIDRSGGETFIERLLGGGIASIDDILEPRVPRPRQLSQPSERPISVFVHDAREAKTDTFGKGSAERSEDDRRGGKDVVE